MNTAKLARLAEECGLDVVGVTNAAELVDLEPELENRRKAGFYPPPFVEEDLARRLNPELFLPGARSIIVAGVSYSQRPMEMMTEDLLRGELSRSAWGEDYHQVLRKRLTCLQHKLEDHFGEYRSEIHIDTGPLIERAIGVRAGLGNYGRNCALINPEFGSWLFLGSLITDLEFADAFSVQSRDICGACSRCIDACPTGALQNGYLVDPHRCLSYITQMTGPVPREMRPLMETRIYGCDTCQAICPHNRTAKSGDHPEFRPLPSPGSQPDLLALLSISNTDFKNSYGKTASGWRGKRTLQRNAIYALGNVGDERAVPQLIGLLKNDSRPLIRGAAAWALGQIGGVRAMNSLQEARECELDTSVLKEIEEALASPD